jgi:uncharacterized protein YjbI with pentapeptide repeats
MQLDEFNFYQQQEWLSKYKKFYPESYLNSTILNKYQTENKFIGIKELIAQPVFLHLIATMNIDIANVVNQTEVYTRLFDHLVNRPWAPQIELVSNIQPKILRAALGEIAHEIFFSEKGYIPKSNFEQLKKVKLLEEKLDSNLEIWRNVMIVFYMNEVNVNKELNKSDKAEYEYALEFLHKSLSEYLCSEHIWSSIKEKFNSPSPESSEKDLNAIYDIFRSKIITKEICTYLIQLIENDKEFDKSLIVNRLTISCIEMFKSSFLPKAYTKLPINTICANFYGFMTVMSCLDNEKKFINETVSSELCRLIRLLSIDNSSFLDLSRSRLSNSNLFNANLSDSNLSGIDLNQANLSNINLNSANLTEANLYKANLEGAYMNGSTLLSANLIEANLTKSNLIGTNLTVANLHKANLKGADMYGAILYGSHLELANLSFAKLIGANLKESFLVFADLDFTDLSSANLSFANLESASMYGANLYNAKLINTYLYKSILYGASLKLADLTDAFLEDADLSATNLEGANLERAYLKGANLKYSNLKKSENLTIEQLKLADSLYQCIGIPEEIEEELRITDPELFKDPSLK